MKAVLKTGKEIMPGDKLLARVQPFAVEEDGHIFVELNARPVEVDATVTSLTFERDEAAWYGSALAEVPVFDKVKSGAVREYRSRNVRIDAQNCMDPDAMRNDDVQLLGKSMYLPWNTVYNMVRSWGKRKFGPHVEASPGVEPNCSRLDVYITIEDMVESDFDVFNRLFEYDKNCEYDAKDEFESYDDTFRSLLPYPVSMGVLNEVFQDCGLGMIGTAVNVEDGVLFTANSIIHEEDWR